MCVFPTLSPFLGDPSKGLKIYRAVVPTSVACITHQIVEQAGKLAVEYHFLADFHRADLDVSVGEQPRGKRRHTKVGTETANYTFDNAEFKRKHSVVLVSCPSWPTIVYPILTEKTKIGPIGARQLAGRLLPERMGSAEEPGEVDWSAESFGYLC